jgi:16S rRNA (guanine527-N7)-methyltransferase
MIDEIARLLDERAGRENLPLPEALRDRLLAYYALLERWNQKINLTSLTDPVKAVDRLLLEPIAAAQHLPAGARLADLGSGGGSPAIPLALALGSADLLMVESRARKAAFLREAARAVELNATVEAVRFEELRHASAYEGTADVVSMRAVRPDVPTLEVARWLAVHGGKVAFFTSTPNALPWQGQRSTWNIGGSAMLVLFHVEHTQ